MTLGSSEPCAKDDSETTAIGGVAAAGGCLKDFRSTEEDCVFVVHVDVKVFLRFEKLDRFLEERGRFSG